MKKATAKVRHIDEGHVYRDYHTCYGFIVYRHTEIVYSECTVVFYDADGKIDCDLTKEWEEKRNQKFPWRDIDKKIKELESKKQGTIKKIIKEKPFWRFFLYTKEEKEKLDEIEKELKDLEENRNDYYERWGNSCGEVYELLHQFLVEKAFEETQTCIAGSHGDVLCETWERCE